MKSRHIVNEPSFEELKRARLEALPPGLREIADQAEVLADLFHFEE